MRRFLCLLLRHRLRWHGYFELGAWRNRAYCFHCLRYVS